MAMAILLLAANYAVHFFSGIRFFDINMAILMNLSTYKRMWTHIFLWAAFSVLSGIVLLLLPDGKIQIIGLASMAAWLVGYGLFLVRRLHPRCLL